MKTQGGSPGRLGQRKPFQTAAISSSASQGDSRQTWYRVQLQRGKDQLSHHRGCLRLNPEKTLVLIGVCCSEGLRVPRACGNLGCVVAEAELQLLGSCFTRRGAGRRAESESTTSSASAKSWHETCREVPQLSRLSGREPCEVIGGLGWKANSLYQAAKAGLSRCSGSLALCTLIIA